MEEPQPQSSEQAAAAPPKRKMLRMLLNVLIVGMIGVVGYFSYSYLAKGSVVPGPAKATPKVAKVIQLDVLNGCGIKGAGIKFTR